MYARPLTGTRPYRRCLAKILEEEIDLHESTLRKLAVEKEQAVPILAFLNNKARHRNWGRPADDVTSGTAATHFHLHLGSERMRALQDLEDAELRALLARTRRELLDDAAEPPLIDVTPKT
jgi:hypothetical protein